MQNGNTKQKQKKKCQWKRTFESLNLFETVGVGFI